MRENALIASLRKLFDTADPSVIAGSGPDDCAHVRAAGGVVSMSVDAFAEGSHFLPDAAPEDVAHKALASSLSDLAASGCCAKWALVSLCLRAGLPDDWSGRFAAELAKTARRYGVAIVGGDTIASPLGTFVSMTVAGEPLPGGPILRRGARPGDVLAVTGELGGSILGRHFRPIPRLAEMRFLMDFCARRGARPSAAMDISDGLALDLSRLCEESGVGATVFEESVPISAAARELASARGGSPLGHALGDGEDFELLVALPPAVWRELAGGEGGAKPAGLAPFTRIGEVREGKGMTLRDRAGRERVLEPKGYEHRW